MKSGKRILGNAVSLVAFLAALQLLRIGIKSGIFLFVERTAMSDRIASLIAMVLLTVVLIRIARRRKTELSIFPTPFTLRYILATGIAVALLILTPILTHDDSVNDIILLVYSAVVVPAFEELVFRSMVWNRLNRLFSREWITYLVDAVLFALWHLGYADTLAFHAGTGLMRVLFWKAVTGLCFGLVLGAVRLGTKNSYSTMLLHGILNIFGR